MQERQPSRHDRMLATVVSKLLQCHICHLMARPPVMVTTCCRQWLGCQRCFHRCSGRRCPQCNRDGHQPVALRGMNDLNKVAKEVGKTLGRQLLHSSDAGADDSSSGSEALPPLSSPAAAQQVTAANLARAAAGSDQAGTTGDVQDNSSSEVLN